MVLALALAVLTAPASSAAPAPLRDSATPFAWLQFVHTAAGLGAVDVYIDGQVVLDDLAFEAASPFMPMPAGRRTIDLVAGSDPDNARPLWTVEATLAVDANYAFVAVGSGDSLRVAVRDRARRQAETGDAEFWVVQGAVDAPLLDIRRLDPRVPNQLEDLIVNNIAFGEHTTYRRLEPMAHDFQVTSADNAVEFARFRFDLSTRGGQALVFVLSGRLADGSLRLLSYDADGHPLAEVPVGTADAAPLQEPFVLRSSHPNPFHRTTTITFDLPETASIHLDVFDLLGRVVMTTPAQRRPAGAGQTLAVEASALTSGVYVYRVVAQTSTGVWIRAGRLVRAR